MSFRDARGRLLKGNPLVFKKGNVPWNRGIPRSDETKRKISEANQGRRLSEEHKRKVGDGNRGKVLSDETKARISESRKRLWEAPEFRERMCRALKGREQSEETRQRISDTLKRKYVSGEIVQPFKGKKHTEESRRNMSENHYDVSGKNNPMYGKKHSEEALRKMLKAVNAKPNRPEQFLIDLFQEHNLPFRYVGAGDFILGSKCPDFLNYNGKKQLIELYGDYWHKGEDPQERIDFFKGFGFDTLVIWEHELENPSAVLGRVESFGVG